MSDDLISRQAAIDYLLDALYDLDEEDYVDEEFIEEELKRVPSVQPKQKTGRWIYMKDCEDWFCSNCKDIFILLEGTPKDNNYNYCPNCGAKMEVKE